VPQTLGFLGPAFFLSQLGNVNSVPSAVACMMGAQGFDAFSQSGLYSNHQDIGPRYSGVLLGMSNTAGVLAGVLGSLATGHLLAVGTWSDVWAVAVVLYLVGTVIWNLFATGERIFD
jgi:ACS family sodium-dependent inorganic phosphate cotransporter